MRIVKSLVRRKWRYNGYINGNHIYVELQQDAIELLEKAVGAASEIRKCIREADEIGGLLKEFDSSITRATIDTDSGGFFIIYDNGSAFHGVSAWQIIQTHATSEEIRKMVEAFWKIERKYGTILNMETTYTPTPNDRIFPSNAKQRAMMFREVLREMKKTLRRIDRRMKAQAMAMM